MNYLFPHKYKKASGWIFAIGITLGLYIYTQSVGNSSSLPFRELLGIKLSWGVKGYLDEIFCSIIIISGLINAFSKEKIEDELIAKLRIDSLILSLYINYGFVIIGILFVYNYEFIYIMEFNLFTPLILFILVFRIKLYIQNK